MKYVCSVKINAPLKEVMDLWNNEKHFKEWQDGFVKIDHVQGKKGRIGSKSNIHLEQGKRKMELKETILVNNLPEEKTALYEHVHMTNTQTSRFEAINENTTKYISEVEYTKFSGFIPKLMAKVFPSMFKTQSQKWMDQFKDFVEKHPK